MTFAVGDGRGVTALVFTVLVVVDVRAQCDFTEGRVLPNNRKSNGCNSHTDTAGSLPTAYRHDIVESRNLRLVGMCEQGPGSLEAIALHESSEG